MGGANFKDITGEVIPVTAAAASNVAVEMRAIPTDARPDDHELINSMCLKAPD